MKKSVIGAAVPVRPDGGSGEGWVDLEQLASVEVTSENPDYPVESVFASDSGRGWRAAEAGRQVIRLIFAEPQPIRRIRLEFAETQAVRLQEFTLKWVASGGKSGGEIVRQQWNFSPQGSNEELEDYKVDLANVSVLELALIPDLNGSGAIASLFKWRVG